MTSLALNNIANIILALFVGGFVIFAIGGTVRESGEEALSLFKGELNKSLTELDELLVGMSLTFGMDISKYKLDKE